MNIVLRVLIGLHSGQGSIVQFEDKSRVAFKQLQFLKLFVFAHLQILGINMVMTSYALQKLFHLFAYV